MRLCLDCIDDFSQNESAVRTNASVDEIMKEATQPPQDFAKLFSGEPNSMAQKVAIEVKLMDAIFAAALAPYNRRLNNSRPFSTEPVNENPEALMKFLFVTLQRCIFSNQTSQFYFCSRSARVWESKKSGSGDEANSSLLSARRNWKAWSDIIIAQGF